MRCFTKFNKYLKKKSLVVLKNHLKCFPEKHLINDSPKDTSKENTSTKNTIKCTLNMLLNEKLFSIMKIIKT